MDNIIPIHVVSRFSKSIILSGVSNTSDEDDLLRICLSAKTGSLTQCHDQCDFLIGDNGTQGPLVYLCWSRASAALFGKAELLLTSEHHAPDVQAVF